MRPTRRRAPVKPITPSPVISEDEMNSSEMDESDTIEQDKFSDEDIDTHDLVDSLDMSDEDMSDDMQDMDEEQDMDDGQDIEEDMDEEEEEEEEEQIHRKNTVRNNKKKIVLEDTEDEFSDDTEVVRNKPMTKRQRAKMYHEIPEDYLELPMDSGKKKHLTEEEEQLRKSEVARRRKNQSIQRAEKDKADTINRLLKKQASKSKRIIDDTEDKQTPHEKLMKQEDPHRIRYINTIKGSQLNIPSIYTLEQIFGINKHTHPITKKSHCEVKGCNNNRKYTTKKHGRSVCSLEHYRLVETK
ncbi:PAPA-1-like conserved region-domain-containing protein [Pilobolus umbonatus]|nr:PAPA-1-like conserved region-domain-containing protein [Pilobolus umbonatus]